MTQPRLLIFDVNETLLDLKPLARRINAVLSNELAFELWFSTLLQYSLVETLSGKHQDFSKIAKATFKMTAAKFKKVFAEDEIDNILSLITKLPAHSDVTKSLASLKNQNYTLVALTNGNAQVAKEQLAFAEIAMYFDRIFSVDEVAAFKPSAKPYQYVLSEMQIDPADALLVAAHGWDITGAQRARLKTAFIGREGKFKYPLAEKPTFDCKGLTELVERLT